VTQTVAVATRHAWRLAAGKFPLGDDGAAQLLFGTLRLAVGVWSPGVLVVVELVVALISGLEGLSSLTFVFGLDGLSPIGVWDVLSGGTHDGHGTG